MSEHAKNVKVSRDTERWEVGVKAELPAEVLARHRELALKEIQKSAKLDGFRQGHAPLDRIVAIYGEEAVLTRAAEHAIQEELPNILAAEKLLIIEAPRVTTEKPEAGKPLVFSARAALAPSVELPDYKKIAKKHTDKKEEISVSDEEHAQALIHLRRERARIDKIEAGGAGPKAPEETRAAAEKD